MDPIIIAGHVRVNATASTRGPNITLGPKQQLDKQETFTYYYLLKKFKPLSYKGSFIIIAIITILIALIVVSLFLILLSTLFLLLLFIITTDDTRRRVVFGNVASDILQDYQLRFKAES